MLTSLRKAYAGGYRAGRCQPRIFIAGGSRNVKQLIKPLNPYRNPFRCRTRLLLSMAWESGYYDGLMKRLAKYETPACRAVALAEVGPAMRLG